MLFADSRDSCFWAAYHPAERAWMAIEESPPADQITRYTQVGDAVLAFVEEQYPGQQVALLRQAFPTR